MAYKRKKLTGADTKIIAHNLKAIRERCGVSQQELGNVLGVTFQQVQKYENGSNRLSMEKLFRLREFYDLPYDAFFEGLKRKQAGPVDSERMTNDIFQLLRHCSGEEKRKMRDILYVMKG